MRSTNLAFDMDYLECRKFNMPDEEVRLFNQLTSDYCFRCDNYAVAYQLLPILDKVKLCEHSSLTDDCFWPYSWIIFITCRPEDIGRIKCIANRIPSSIPANIHIYDEEEKEI